MNKNQIKLLVDLYRVLTSLLLESHISDDVDEAVESMHNMIAWKLAEIFMLEHGYKRTDLGYERKPETLVF